MPQVPTSQIDKNVKFQAAYTSRTFNKKNLAFYRIDGILEGMQVTPFGSGSIRVSAGAFIQRGVIIELLNDFVFPKPLFPFPWTVYADTADEASSTPTFVDIAPSGSEPAGVVIIATTEDADTFVHPKQISIKAICQKVATLENERKIRRNYLCNAGFELLQPSKGISFVMPGPGPDCWHADNLSDKAPGSALDIITDPAQTLRGGSALRITSETYLDPGGVQPDLSVAPARVRSNARIYQFIPGYKDLVGEPLTFGCSLRLPTGHPGQLHDLEISIYGSSIGTPGFSDVPVDKFSLVIPAASLSQNWQKFWVHGTVVNLNVGKAVPALPAFPGITVRIAFINTEPAAFPTGVVDKVLVDDCMLYMGTVENPVFFPVPFAVDWLQAGQMYEAQKAEMVEFGMATDIEYRLGKHVPFATRKFGAPTVSFENLEVTEDGSPYSANSEASYLKAFLSTGDEEYRVLVAKVIAGFRPSRMNTLVRAQS